jgi:endogenous inhibitor of DNA gyrase (YacG/DUF329 family)
MIIVRCSNCGHSVEVELNKYDGIPTPRKIARIVERLGACPKCGKQFGSPRIVAVRWLA